MAKKDMAVLKAEIREGKGTKVTEALRQEKRIPAVVYGPAVKENINVSVDLVEFEKILNSQKRNHLFTLDMGKKSVDVIIKDYKIHPLRRDIVHVDFYVVDPKKPFKTYVPIVLEGTSIGVKEGGKQINYGNKLLIRALYKDIPDYFVANISSLARKQYFLAGAIEFSESVQLMSSPGTVLVEIK